MGEKWSYLATFNNVGCHISELLVSGNVQSSIEKTIDAEPTAFGNISSLCSLGAPTPAPTAALKRWAAYAGHG